MKAMAFAKTGGLDVLEEIELPVPELEDDEVLVEVKACALNHLDLWMREGLPYSIPMPHIGGCETVGTIAHWGARAPRMAQTTGFAHTPGSSSPLQEGALVMIAPEQSCRRCWECLHDNDPACPDFRVAGLHTQGGFAQFAKAKAWDLLPLTDAWSAAEWAALPLTFLTAWHMLHRRARLRPGENVLVHAAGSGVGTAAIQVAKHAGARVIATASTDEKLAHARKLGADHTINYASGEFAKQVRDHTGGRGADVVVEHIGESVWKETLRAMAKGARLVTCGATSGPTVQLDLRVLFTRELSLAGSYMGSRGELLEVLRLAELRVFKPVVDRVFPMSRLREAQEHMHARQQFGKIVVEPDW